MGFFDKVFKSDRKGTKKEGTTKSFSPVVLVTRDVPLALHETAQKFGLSPHALDIRLLTTRTYIKMDEKEGEWTEVEENDWERFNTPEILLNPNFQVMQEHEIEIHKYKEEPWSKDLMLHIAANREKNRIVCTIKGGSILRKTEGLTGRLKGLIHAKMVRSKILIGIWDLDFESVIDEIAAKAMVEGEYKVPEDYRFDVAACYPSQPSVNDALILHYKKKGEQEGDRVDHSRRGFIQAVEKGEVIIEYVKPRFGTPGRNCLGEFIPVEEPTETHRPDFRVSDAIAVEESDTAILYRAKRGGYVVFEEGTYDIREEMEVDEVSFKKTGSIDAGIETDVKIHVNEKDFLKDAIGTGVEVEATEVKVEGNVGASAVVLAEHVVIGGQTHQSSRIEAGEAVINVHRGTLICKKGAKITRIEGGSVEAREVEAQQMIGGEIRAIEVDVRLLGANARIYAVSRIEVGKMVGENNKLVIDASQIDAYHHEILRLEEEKERLEEEHRKLLEKLQEREELLQKSEPAIQTLKQKLLQDQKKGVKPRPAFVAKIRQFQKLKEQIVTIKEEIAKRGRAQESLKEKLLAYQEMVTRARVINRGAWKEYTTVEFHLLYPQITLEYRPEPGAANQEVYLQKVGEEEYEIAVREVAE